MDKERITKALEELKKEKKRKFVQSYDLIVNLKDIDVKTQPVDLFAVLPHSKGKKAKICGILGVELADKGEKVFELVIQEKDLDGYKADPKKAKILAGKYDYFVAQANLMPKVATVFGRVLGPKGKMPNPKAGCVVPPNADLVALNERLQRTVRVIAKNAPVVQCIVGSEDMSDNDVTENVLVVYNALVKALPNEENNIKGGLIKKTMSKVVNV